MFKTESLKQSINVRAADARALRQQARAAFAKGRSLRAEARKANNQALLALGNVSHDEGLKCRSEAEADRWMRRVLCLSAGMLHNKTFLQCEQKHTSGTMPWPRQICHEITPFLPPEEQKFAYDYVEAWLKEGTVTLRSLRERFAPKAVAA